MIQRFDTKFLDELSERAKKSERKRMHFDLRDTENDTSMRMLNAIEPETCIPVHRHTMTSEDVLVVRGECEEVIYEENSVMSIDGLNSERSDCKVLREIARIRMKSGTSEIMCHIPQGKYHTCISLVSGTIIYEAKNTCYNPRTTEDIWNGTIISSQD